MFNKFKMLELAKKWFLIKVFICMVQHFNPAKHLRSPLLFVFLIGSIILTVVFLILWLRQGFDFVSFKAMATAWSILIFCNFCEALFETVENENKK